MTKTTFHSNLPGRVPVLLSVFLAALICAPSFASSEESCTRLLSSRCEVCHYLARVCQKVEREMNQTYWIGDSKGTWKRTLQSMARQGAKLSESEEELLVKCLSEPPPELLNLCKLKK